MIVTAANDSICVDVPESASTLDGFRTWSASDSFPQHGRITYFRQGIFLDMSPEKANAHNDVKTEITRVLGNLVRDRDLGKLYSDGLWITNDRADLSNEADATFVSWESLETGRIQLITLPDDDDGIEMRGSPDWVLEVVSNSSEKKDTIWLPEAYYAADVREYWLVDARGARIKFILHVRRPDRFATKEPDDDGWRESEVFGCAVRLDRNRDRVGGWSYTLLNR
jgi:Uma2 family endonuclease